MTPQHIDDSAARGATQIEPEDARQAMKTGHMRWVLGISTASAVIVLGVVAWTYHQPAPQSAMQPPMAQPAGSQPYPGPAMTPAEKAAP